MEEQRQKSWVARNWGWVLGGGCLTLIVLFFLGIGTIFFDVTKMFSSSEPYQHAMESAINNEDVTAILGEPVETDGMMNGSINLSGDDGDADFKIPIKGPKGSGRIVVKAIKDYGEWEYSKLYVQFQGDYEAINLLESETEELSNDF
jgi:hypothetical protein